MLRMYLKRHLPKKALDYASGLRTRLIEAQRKRLPQLGQDDLRKILVNDLGLEPGDVVFIHSSTDMLRASFPFFRVLHVLREVLGPGGTMVFPTYPKLSSYEYLTSGEVFDVRKTPSYTGALTEFARKQRNAVRSLHPTKSVCAIGPRAVSLTNSHPNSPYPYDNCSPYYKLVEENAKIIGLGVSTHNMSFVHCVEDALKDRFPHSLYHEQLFDAECINHEGAPQVVRTYAHDLRVVRHDIPRFMNTYVPKTICADMTIAGRPFFTGGARQLFDVMLTLARENVTIYSKRLHRRRTVR
jgi:aminoglycoside 3-N-acetyltransferase